MKRLCLVIVFLCSLTGCASAGKSESGTDKAKAPLAVGDSAVFKFSRQGYVEGKVQSIETHAKDKVSPIALVDNPGIARAK